MASSHRKLNIKQLVTLSEVYWDDAAKLAEILEDLRDRFEPEAAALFRTLTSRVHLLRTNPAAAREQPPPTQRAETDEAEAPAAAAPPAPHSRRRAAVVVAALAAAGIAAWLLWPHRTPPPTVATPKSGPEIALGGPQADEPPKPPGEAIVPPIGTPRRTALDKPEKPPLAGGGGGGGGAGAGGAGSGGGFDGAAALLRQLAKPRATGTDVPEPAETAARDSQRQARDIDAAPRAAARGSANASASSPSPPGAAEAGIAVSDAQLTCDRTDSRRASCDDLAGAADAAAAEPPEPPESPARDDQADASPPVPPAASGAGGSGGSGASGRAATPSLQSSAPQSAPTPPPASAPASPAAASSPAGGGGAGPAGGGGGGASPAGGGSAAGRGPTPPAKTKADPPQPAAPEAVAAATPPPSCPPAPASGRVVFILDGSVSMGLPLDVDADLEDALDDGIRRHDPKARQEYRALLAEPGPKRITRAREAFAAAAADLPPKVDLGLVVFQECRDIRKVGVFNAARRGKAVDYIRALVPHGRTPIADSLRRAAEMLGKGPSSIVLLTDGREFCDGDPCAAAAEIKAAHPHTPVSIVDITGEEKSECVAEITGGRSYKPGAAEDLARVVSAAFRAADPLCTAEAEPGADAAGGKTAPEVRKGAH